tara:strand:+ start:9488 stop:10240 length:753 start_codon:yes stop_codon:yes gene_type:complete
MTKIIRGKNIIKKNIKFNKDNIFSDNNQYYYKQIILKKNNFLNFDYLKSFTLYVLQINSNCELLINKKLIKLQEGDCIQIENQKIKIDILSGKLCLFVAGTKETNIKKKSIKKFHKKSLYKVEKPWGYEIWVNGRHKNYAFKKIYIKKGFKTSLQFHNFKCETNILYNGRAELTYKKNNRIHELDVKDKDLGFYKIKGISSLSVKPKTLHRIKALSNITLFETSTPHLDDVIRVSDDAMRSSGLIKSEHK